MLRACLEYIDILRGKKLFSLFCFSPISMKFTAGSKTGPELCFHKHIISTIRIIQKHIIITHIISSALWIRRFLIPFQTLLVRVYKPHCVYQDATQCLARGGSRCRFWDGLHEKFAKCSGNFKKCICMSHLKKVYSFNSQLQQHGSHIPLLVPWNSDSLWAWSGSSFLPAAFSATLCPLKLISKDQLLRIRAYMLLLPCSAFSTSHESFLSLVAGTRRKATFPPWPLLSVLVRIEELCDPDTLHSTAVPTERPGRLHWAFWGLETLTFAR